MTESLEQSAQMTKMVLNDSTNALYSFLQNYKTKSQASHTLMGPPYGSFFIPSEKTDILMELYKHALDDGCPLYVVEQHKSYGPVLIDLDFRQQSNDHLYTDEYIETFILNLMDVVKNYLQLDEVECFVLEKPPRPTSKSGIYKDGLHMVFPNLVTCPEVQFMIRDHFLKKYGHTLKNDPSVERSIDEIYDEQVIKRNGWLMYASFACLG